MTNTDIPAEATIEEPELLVVYEDQCPSLTGRSVLTFQIGHHPEDVHKSLHLRIARNSGGGMFCRDWAGLAAINEILTDAKPVTARSLCALHPGRSINTGGFVLAVLKDLGVVRAKNDNTRHHECVPGVALVQAVHQRMSHPPTSEVKVKAQKGRTG